MQYGICVVPVSPMRAEPAHRSEMVSQVLLGEWAEILAVEKEDWIRVRNGYDGYEGWCARNQWTETNRLPPGVHDKIYVSDWTDKVLINGTPAWVPMGTPVVGPAMEDIHIEATVLRYMAASPWDAASAAPTAEQIEARAFRYLNTPYLWGGRTVFGMDCSGFTQSVFRFFNIALLRDAWQQATQGEGVGFLQEVRGGDLAFFDNEEGRIVHVGILLNDQQIIHASGKVRIDRVDNQGIVHAETGRRTHKLRLIKRVIESLTYQ